MEEDMMEPKTEGGEVKRIRRRRKRIYQAILKQMEFYFSDANLLKDRFLSKLIKDDPYVDLNVFLTFNKIRTLTNNVEDIANALMKSELLKLSSDRSKVCRDKPLNPNYNEDECSIYVENLPLDAKHDWLSEVFSVYGKVAYVSIPKYRQSGKIKGFAFVEFESAESANRALEAYGSAGCCLPTDMPPENLCSIATFEPGEGKNQVGFVERPVKLEEEINEQKLQEVEEKAEAVSIKKEPDDECDTSPPKEKRKKKKLEDDEDANEEPSVEKERSPTNSKKKRPKEECVSDEEEDDSHEVPKKKKKKVKSPEEEESSLLKEGSTSVKVEEDASPVSKKKAKRAKEDTAEEDCTKGDEDNGDTNITSTDENSRDKEKRKRKLEESNNDEDEPLEDDSKKAKVDEGEEAEKEEAIASENPDQLTEKKKKKRKRNKEKKEKLTEEAICLQILSKKEWKRLRNKYLMLQRKNMKQLRAQIMGHRWDGPWRRNDRNGEEMHDEGWHGEEEYHETEEHHSNDKEKAEKNTESSIRVQFTPGVIVKVQLKEPLESAKKFKAEVKHLPKSNVIAYIDARDAKSIVHLRCETAEAAKDVLADLPWEDKEIIDGEEEKEYWDKILQDRDEKIKKKIRVKKRGRDKILDKAENLIGKHTHYDN